MWQEKEDETDFPLNNSSRIKTFVFLTESECSDLLRQNESLAKIHGYIFNCFRMKPFFVYLLNGQNPPGDGDQCCNAQCR